MSIGRLYTPEEIKAEYDEVVPSFINAFAEEPWFEVSKCADTEPVQRCAGGLSALAVGDMCEVCLQQPTEPAYTPEGVIKDFEAHADTYPTVWYLEKVETGVATTAYASLQSSQGLLESTYRRSPGMDDWLGDHIGNQPVAWLHEIFANRRNRSHGNLRNFGAMCVEFADHFETPKLAYCTINPRMIAAAERDFGTAVEVYFANQDLPDRRHMVVINL